MGNDRLGQVKHGMDVDVERLPPLLVADLADFVERRLMGGVIDQNVDPPKFIKGTLDKRTAVVGIPNISSDQDRLVTFCFD